MHKEILSKNQKELLPLVKDFSNEFYLAGGTAVGLYIGHRQSIDFDLFTRGNVKRRKIKNYLVKKNYPGVKLRKEEEDQIHFIINNTKITFFNFPFDINELNDLENIIKVPSLLNLAAMKAFDLGGRGKWKDYVDLYFLLRYHFELTEIIERAAGLFGEVFNAKLFKEQLTFFEDIDYEEEVTYLIQPVDENEIKKLLIDAATEKL